MQHINAGRTKVHGAIALTVVAALALAVALLGAGPAAAKAEPLAERVVIVLVNGIGWEDLELPQAAGVRKVFESGWAANLNAPARDLPRTVARTMVSLGAGSGADDGGRAGAAYLASEAVEGDRAAEAYVRRSGRLPGGARILHLGVASMRAANVDFPYPVVPGSMGGAVALLDRRTAVLGNGDEQLWTSPDRPHREAVAVAMDEDGRVDFGAVGPEVLIPDAEMAYGVRTNTALLLHRYRALPDDVGLVVIDLGDTERASRYGSAAAPAAERFLRGRAMSRASEFLERFTHLAGEGTAIIVLSGTDDVTGIDADRPTPFVMVLPGARPGLAQSGTTRRAGLVSGQDLVRTVVHVLAGYDAAPSDVPGRPIVRSGGPRTPVLARLAEASRRSALINAARPAVLWTWLIAQLAGVVLGAFLLRSKAEDEGASRLTEALLLWLVALPLAGLLVGWLPPSMFGWASVVVFSMAFAAALAAGLALTPLRPSRQLLVVLGALGGVLFVDQVVAPLGWSRLAADTVFGYSLVEGGRYYGIGNEAWSLLFAAVALGAGLWLDTDRVDWARRRWVAAGVLVAVTLLVGLPVLGANVGGFIACATGSIVMWLGWDGRRPGWRTLAVVLVVLAVGLGVLAGFDLVRPAEQATHLGVAARQVGADGLDAAMATVRRKVGLNLLIFRKVPLSLLMIPLLLFLVVERRRPAGRTAAFLADRPRLGTALTGVFVAGVVGALTNDTGVTIPALMLAVALPAVLMLMLAARRAPSARPERPPRLLARLGLIKENWRGLPVVTGAGIVAAAAALIAGVLTARWRLGLAMELTTASSVEVKDALVASAGIPAGLIALGAGVVGLADDIAGRADDKGFRGHFGALKEYRVTTGLIKAVYGGAASLVAAWTLFTFGRGAPPLSPDRTPVMLLVDTLVMALSMNAFNLLDLRPGRALKVWLPLAATLWTSALIAAPAGLERAYLQPQLVAAFAVALVLLPFDLRERLMLGDAGTMALGALVGWSIIATMGLWVRVLALVSLAALHIATERISLSSVIDRTPVLSWLDRLGRPSR